ncbi:MAG TPA: hypothetical protein VG826_00740 [Pirellulales bacterium]|nr:hypothetical protein [Pirellulales bacterium]
MICSAAEETKRTWSFDDGIPGQMPQGFHEEVGRWRVADYDAQKVFFQSAENPDDTFNVVLIDGFEMLDVDLTVRFKAVSGVNDRGGGLVWRAKDKRNYYICRYNPLENNFRLYHVVGGKRTLLDSVDIKHTEGWHTIRVTMRGDRIDCYYDGKRYLDADDTMLPDAGRIGLWSKSDARTYFDDLTATGQFVDRPESDGPPATREFSIKDDRPYLAGHPIDLWGLRCGNALYNEATVERHVRNFDNMAAHGINLIGVYIQGVNAGWPNAEAGINGFYRDGRLRTEVTSRLARLIREADRRGMVVMVGLLGPRKDQDFYDDAAIRRAIEETGRFLTSQRLKNVFVDLCHEFNHPERIDKELLREPNGAEKKQRLTRWFKAVAPDIEAGVCPCVDSGTGDSYPDMEVRIIQKNMPVPSRGFVVNVEPLRQDVYQNDGVFNQTNLDYIFADCRRYQEAPNAVLMFHAAFIQGITNFSGTAPHAEMGGYGTGPNDRGVRFYYDWVRDNIGRWAYPRHVPSSEDQSDVRTTQ